MKKFLGLLALCMIISCDDGDMTFQTFNFTDARPESCESGLLYKVSGSEALVLNIDESNFENVVTPPNEPRILTVSTTSNTVQYLKYGTEITGNHRSVICNALPPFSPSEIWIADGGTISVTTRADVDETGRITGYTHTVNLIYLSFTRNGESIIIQDNLFGDIQTQLGYTFNFDADTVDLKPCPDAAELLYIISQSEVLEMDLNTAELFQEAVTGQGVFRQQMINENNKVRLKIYDGTNITEPVACGGAATTPQLKAIWEAYEGTIQVTTAEIAGGGFAHTIKFINTKLRNTANPDETFTITNYTLGDTFDE